MAYATLTELKLDYLGVIGSGDDTLLTSMIARAQAIIDAHTNRTFEASADATRYFDAVRDVVGDVLYLDKDLASITSVTNGDSAALNATTHYVTMGQDAPYYALRLRANAGTTWTYTTDPERAIAPLANGGIVVSALYWLLYACDREVIEIAVAAGGSCSR